MRIGVVHQYYRSSIPSGENLTVETIKTILRNSGHTVKDISGSSDDLLNSKLRKAKTALNHVGLTSKLAISEDQLTSLEHIQIHNSFPIFSKSDFRRIAHLEIPTTIVVHNYRFSCLSGNHFRNNQLCFKCTSSSFKSGIRNQCYQGSTLASMIRTLDNKSYKEFREDNFEKLFFVAISEGIKSYLISQEIPEEKITVINNSVPRSQAIASSANRLLFVGRLEPEKGVNALLEAYKGRIDLPILDVVGTGSLAESVIRAAQENPLIKFHGHMNMQELEDIAHNCKSAIILNDWNEPFGRVTAEALARGQVVITDRNNPLSKFLQPSKNAVFVEKSLDSIRQGIMSGLDLSHGLHCQTSQKTWEDYFSVQSITRKWHDYYKQLREQDE
jgi:glycosyltransferase involved in cell wall biosynthesis